MDVLLDLEITMVRQLGWSLRDIDKTDCESLFAFMGRLSRQGVGEGRRKAFCDEVDFL